MTDLALPEAPEPRASKRIFRWALHLLVSGAVVLMIVLVYRTLRFESKQLVVEPAPQLELELERAAERLAGALKLRTTSLAEPTPENRAAFISLHRYLERSFPRLHKALTREVVAEHSLVYVWKGSEPELPPVLLLGHLDVAPIAPGTDLQWTQKPFAGVILDGEIWGRGALDDKSAVLGQLEAIELALERGFAPKRSLYLAFSHDQIRGGDAGTQALAEHFKQQGLRFSMILGEGMNITLDLVPEIDAPIASVGLSERGTAVFLIEGAPGSTVEQARLEAAQRRLEENPLPAEFSGPAVHQFEYLAADFPFMLRLILANRWLFGGMIESQITSAKGGGALIRSLVTSTRLPADYQQFELPNDPVLVTYRLRQGDTVEDVQRHAKGVIQDDAIQLRAVPGAYLAPPASSVTTPEFKRLHELIAAVFPEALVAPTASMGSTDARHYQGLSDNIYRFRPQVLKPNEIRRTRDADERISLENYKRVVQFYYELLGRFTG